MASQVLKKNREKLHRSSQQRKIGWLADEEEDEGGALQRSSAGGMRREEEQRKRHTGEPEPAESERWSPGYEKPTQNNHLCFRKEAPACPVSGATVSDGPKKTLDWPPLKRLKKENTLKIFASSSVQVLKIFTSIKAIQKVVLVGS